MYELSKRGMRIQPVGSSRDGSIGEVFALIMRIWV